MLAYKREKELATEIESDIEIEDIAAITLYALGYEIPDTYSGIVPRNLFKN